MKEEKRDYCPIHGSELQAKECAYCRKLRDEEETVTVDPPKRVDAPRSVEEILRKKARKPFKVCYNCYEVQEGKIEGDVPESCNDCKNFEDMINVLDAMAVVEAQRAQLKKLIEGIEKLFEEALAEPSDEMDKLSNLTDVIEEAIKQLKRLEMLGQ